MRLFLPLNYSFLIVIIFDVFYYYYYYTFVAKLKSGVIYIFGGVVMGVMMLV